jgi:hypothetical protein
MSARWSGRPGVYWTLVGGLLLVLHGSAASQGIAGGAAAVHPLPPMQLPQAAVHPLPSVQLPQAALRPLPSVQLPQAALGAIHVETGQVSHVETGRLGAVTGAGSLGSSTGSLTSSGGVTSYQGGSVLAGGGSAAGGGSGGGSDDGQDAAAQEGRIVAALRSSRSFDDLPVSVKARRAAGP